MTHGIQRRPLRYLVFAGNFREYRQWALTNGILNGEALYVASPENLLGLRNEDLKLVRIGTFHLRSDAETILREARTRFNVEQWDYTTS